MTKDLQKQIEELEEVSEMEVQEYDCSDVVSYDHAYDIGDDHGSKRTAEKALSIIKELQEEADKYKLLWESTGEDAKAIIAELEHENQEYIKTLRLITAEDGCSRMSKRAFEVLKQFGKL